MEDRNKIQEEIIKADIKSVEKLWKSNIENYSLTALLEKMTKEELVKVAKKYSVKGITALKKSDAVEKIKEIILCRCNEMIYLAEEETIVFLKKLVEEDGLKKYSCTDLAYSNYWRNRGIAFTGIVNDELSVMLSHEMKVLLKDIINKDLINRSKVNTEVIKIIAGMTYHYGVVTFELIKYNLERLFLKEFNMQHIIELVQTGEELGYDYVVEGEILYHIDVEDVDNILKLQENSENHYCLFNKKSLIIAGTPDFIESNKQGIKLEKVISELFVIDKNILKEEMDGFIVAIKNEVNKDEAIERFLQAYEIESDQERNIFVDELKSYAKSIRRWSLKGYSEEELQKDSERIVNEIKIGRNDQCICGSGKKYKKCCGK